MERQPAGAGSGLQNRQAVVARRLEGSIPSPLRLRESLLSLAFRARGIAVLGLVATAGMTVCVAHGRRRTAGALLLAAMGLYAAWGVVLDQATHGSYFWQ
jgi:hypothetical protein